MHTRWKKIKNCSNKIEEEVSAHGGRTHITRVHTLHAYTQRKVTLEREKKTNNKSTFLSLFAVFISLVSSKRIRKLFDVLVSVFFASLRVLFLCSMYIFFVHVTLVIYCGWWMDAIAHGSCWLDAVCTISGIKIKHWRGHKIEQHNNTNNNNTKKNQQLFLWQTESHLLQLNEISAIKIKIENFPIFVAG